ncbi:MAG: lactate racemase domain-containing protein [Dehalococcoidia bacterium]
MKSNTVHVPQQAWYDNDELELQFPASWDVTTCYMRGHNRPPLSEQGFREAFANPIGTKPIRDLARGKSEVVILFDDMSRPTRVAEIVPYVLEELEAAGVEDSSIRFIAAIGAHGALTRIDFAKKLGESVLGRFPVYNHNPYENCTFLGNTSRGTPVAINSEFMACDLKIGIGGILPHPLTGFSGGGKIVLPGVAHIDTMVDHHSSLITKLLTEGRDPGIGIATFEENVMRLDVVEAARMAGLDIKIDTVMNGRGQTTGLFVGDLADAHAEGVKLAREVYATKAVEGSNVIILNAYSKANEAVLAIPLLAPLLGDRPPDLVLIANAPEGQVPHYLVRSFGKKVGGRLWTAPPGPLQNINTFIMLTPYIEIAGADWLAAPESIVWAKTWPEVLERLTETHGERARVAVVPDATMQYFAE